MTAEQSMAGHHGRLSTNRLLCPILLLLILAPFAAAGTPDVSQRLAQIRVPFVENCGQWDERVAFAAKAGFGTVFVTHEGQLVYSLVHAAPGGWTLTETAISGKPAPRPGRESLTRVSDFHGNDPSRWRSGLPSYDEVRLGEVWPRIAVSLRARGRSVEKIFTLQPGARAGRIRLRLDGASSLRLDRDGALVAGTGDGEVRFTAPSAYQEKSGVRQPVDVAYVLRGASYGFRLGAHDPGLPVIVDPLLQATYLGGNGEDGAARIKVDLTTGDVLIAGSTIGSTDFPGTAGGAQPEYGGGDFGDAFVARLNSSLTTLLQSTYLGGSGDDSPSNIAIDPTSGEVLVAGYTTSADFPGTTGGAQLALNGALDGFVARLNPTLTTLLQSTYLGGSDMDGANGIATQPTTGEVLVTGWTYSADFPGTAGGAQVALNGAFDGFVARLDPALKTLLQSTYLGGSDGDRGDSISVHPLTGEVLVAGTTGSTDFPATAGGAQPEPGGGDASDAFVARLDPSLTVLLRATYLGGNVNDFASDMAVNPANGEVFVTGSTNFSSFPGTAGGAQPVGGGSYDGFVARLNPTLTALLQATYLGGSGFDEAFGIAINPTNGDVLVAGRAQSLDFPGTAGGAQPIPYYSWGSSFVARLNATLTTLLQATYLGGRDGASASSVAVHPTSGEVVVAGSTPSTDFPGTAGGAQPLLDGLSDGFVARLTPDLAAILSPQSLSLDPLPGPGDGDFVFEPGETVPVLPSWKNLSGATASPTGHATDFGGPPGATYTIEDDSASYGTIPSGETGSCASIPDCYRMSVSAPAPRPGTHWDARFTETLSTGDFRFWNVHLGDSFPDVPRNNIFYAYIENILHNGVTAGCGDTDYCPADPALRSQMAAFVLRAKEGPSYVPPDALGIFTDVWRFDPFAPWIEELYNRGVVAGCGPGPAYCPDQPVLRQQMAVFLLKTLLGSDYAPPPCTGIFADVPCPGLFTDWIEDLFNRGIAAGCGGGNFCPTSPNTRGQMAPFLVKTFGLVLYGP